MSKITRRSYKRKKIIMGASLFGAIGLVSTGFAAWVLSAPTSATVGPTSLKVGEVTDKNMEFVNLKTYLPDDYINNFHQEMVDEVLTTVYSQEYDKFHFEPAKDDNNGRVRLGGGQAESLGLDVKGKLLKVQNLGNIKAQITLAEDDANHTNRQKLDLAIEKGYIIAPYAYFDPSYPTVKETRLWTLLPSGQIEYADNFVWNSETDSSGDETMIFQYKVFFQWGGAFNYKNPSKYFDEDDIGKTVPTGTPDDDISTGTVGAILSDMHYLLDGLKLTLTLTANPN